LENLSLLHSTTEEGREEKVKHAADELKKVIEGLEKAAKCKSAHPSSSFS
jgi:hypothetical protein